MDAVCPVCEKPMGHGESYKDRIICSKCAGAARNVDGYAAGLRGIGASIRGRMQAPDRPSHGFHSSPLGVRGE